MFSFSASKNAKSYNSPRRRGRTYVIKQMSKDQQMKMPLPLTILALLTKSSVADFETSFNPSEEAEDLVEFSQVNSNSLLSLSLVIAFNHQLFLTPLCYFPGKTNSGNVCSCSDLLSISVARIAIGKKVFKTKCVLSFLIVGAKEPYMVFAFEDKKSVQIKVSLIRGKIWLS